MVTNQTQTTTKWSFNEELPNGKTLFFVDATLLKDLAHCEQYFAYRHVLNKRAKFSTKAKPFPMAIGSWWSTAMEKFYGALMEHKAITTDDIMTFSLQAWAENDLDDCMVADPDKFIQFGDLAGSVLMLQDYYNSQYLIDQQNWEIVGVETGFGLNREVFIGESDSVVVFWIGRPDLVVLEGGQRLIPIDHKTVTRIDGDTITRYKPSAQMPGYIYATQIIAKQLGITQVKDIDRCIINICSRSRPTDKPRSGPKRPRFIRAYPTWNRDEIEEWKQGVIHKCERIAHCLKYNDWVWSETGCDNLYMRKCDYKKVDSVVPAARDIIFEADFVTGEPWKPYQITKVKDKED